MLICDKYNYLLHNEINNDILKTIPDTVLPTLRDLFKQNYPYAVQAYQFVDQMIKWKEKNPKTGVRFTCPEGDWNDGTFVAIFTECTFNIYFFTLQKSGERLCHALRRTKLIEWSKGPYICALHNDLDDVVMKTLQLVGVIEFTIESTTWWLPKEIGLELEIKCPDDVYISSLTPKHLPIINAIWPHSFPDSESYLANLINKNYNYGIFTKSENKLISWIFLNDFGAHAILQTLPDYKRKGYAGLLIKILAKKLAENGSDSITYIVRKNIVSQTLFTSVGFKKNNNIRWVQFKEIVSKNLKNISRL